MADRVDVFEELRRRLRCPDVAHRLGLRVRGRYFQCPQTDGCPSAKHGRLTAQSSSGETWRCHACSEQGDSVDLIRIVRGCSAEDARTEAMRLAGIDVAPGAPLPPPPPPPPPPLELSDAVWATRVRALTVATDHYDRVRREGGSYLRSLQPALQEGDLQDTLRGRDAALAYLQQRGFAALAVLPVPVGVVPAWRTGLRERVLGEGGPDLWDAACGVGLIQVKKRGHFERYAGRLWLPWRDGAGDTLAAKGRAIPALAASCGVRVDEAGHPQPAQRFQSTTGSAQRCPEIRPPGVPFGWYAQGQLGGAHPLLVVEGEIDALSALSVGWPAVATGGRRGAGRRGLPALVDGRAAVVLFDGDRDPKIRRGTARDAQVLARELGARWAQVPQGDLNDVLGDASRGAPALADLIDACVAAAVYPAPDPALDAAQRAPGGPPLGRPADLAMDGQPAGWGLRSNGALLRLVAVDPRDGREAWEDTGAYNPPVIEWRGRDVADQAIVVGLRGQAVGVPGVLRVVVGRGVVRDARSITGELAPKGFDVESGTAGVLVRYLADYERAFGAELPLRHGATQMGWHGRTFLYGTDSYGPGEIAYIGENPQRVDALRPRGAFDQWVAGVLRPLERYPVALLGLYASLAAPVIAHLPDLPGFGVEFAGLSSKGKSTATTAIASAWGDPSEDAGLLRYPRTDTPTSIERYAAFQGCLPLFLEDTHTMEHDAARDVVMLLVNGVGKGRAKRDGKSLQHSDRWASVTLFTGEESITQSTTYGGVSARVLSFPPPLPDATDLPADQAAAVIADVRSIERTRTRHCGHAGRAWVRALAEGGLLERVLEVYDDWLPILQRQASLSGPAQRWAKYLALVLATQQVAEPVIGGAAGYEGVLEVALDYLSGSRVPDQATEAMERVLSWVATDASGGVDGDTGQPTGHPPRVWFRVLDDGTVCVDAVELRRRLALEGIALTTVRREWVARGWCAWRGEPKGAVKARMARGSVWCVPIAPGRAEGFGAPAPPPRTFAERGYH